MTRPTISGMFAEQVARFPGNLAVIADDGTFTYQELAAKATAVAAVVRQDGGTTPVALLCRHGATTIAALLGVLIAGRPYVPLDQTFPMRRLAYQLADSGSGLLLTDDTKFASALGDPALGGPALDDPVRVVDIDPVLATASTVDLDSAAQPDDPAYLLYTSGSTGVPKGVVQNHRNVVFAAHNQIRNCGITPADRTSVLTSFGFDMAVTDMYSALLSGAAAVPIDIRTHGLAKLATLLTERGVTLYHSTPTVYRYLVASLGENRNLPAIRVVLLGGEEVNARDVRLCRSHFGPQCVFVNGYGTTEVSFITQNHIPATADDTVVGDGVVPIGHPLAGLEVILLDADGRPNPDVGEILVRSRHVAHGYHGKAGLTAGNRFTTVGSERTYRTGDLARRLPNGMLAFLGRADRQVKIRGYRVEIGDVETQLADLPGVAQAAVVARRSGPHGDTALIGYVVPGQGTELDMAATTAALRDRLPEYMVPRVIVPLAELPLTVTGKLDQDALPDPPLPDPPPAGHMESEPGGLEAEIAQAWRVVLELQAIGRDDNFYEIGGHSLLMALVQQRLERSLGRKLPMATLFAYPTIRTLAAHLTGDGTPDRTDSGRERAIRRQEARARRAGK